MQLKTVEDWTTLAFGGERAIGPIGDSHEDYKSWRALGIRLDKAEYWPWKDIEEVVKDRIAALGISYEEFVERGVLSPPRQEFRKYEKDGFATPTSKIELYSTAFEKLGYDPLPYYEEPPESPVRTPELSLETGANFNIFLILQERTLLFLLLYYDRIDDVVSF